MTRNKACLTEYQDFNGGLVAFGGSKGYITGKGKKHSDLKTKFFKEIQDLYEKVKRSNDNFIAIGSFEDERLIKDLNKKATGIKKDDSIKEESK
ncbi:hypothetical protein Tco_1027313 [Tanacetum coccineum]